MMVFVHTLLFGKGKIFGGFSQFQFAKYLDVLASFNLQNLWMFWPVSSSYRIAFQVTEKWLSVNLAYEPEE